MSIIVGLIALVFIITSPWFEKMGITGKVLTCVILVPVSVILCAAIQLATETPEQKEARINKEVEQEIKEKHQQWDKEADDKAIKKFYDSTRPYR